MKFKNTLQSPHGTRVFTQIKQASEVKERGFLDTTVHPQLPSRTWAVVNQGSTGAGIWVTLIALNLRQKQMALPVGISQRREFPMRYVHGNYPSWVSWHAPSSFVRKSLEWHVSWLGNESCFWIWKIWLQQARGKCLLLLPAGRSIFIEPEGRNMCLKERNQTVDHKVWGFKYPLCSYNSMWNYYSASSFSNHSPIYNVISIHLKCQEFS